MTSYPKGRTGTCEPFHRMLAALYPELTLMHGVLESETGVPGDPTVRVEHWWCEDPEGRIVDRTYDPTIGVNHRWVGCPSSETP